jgi:hypothetical protein
MAHKHTRSRPHAELRHRRLICMRQRLLTLPVAGALPPSAADRRQPYTSRSQGAGARQ